MFYESKVWKYMHTSCAQKAVISDIEIRNTSIETILFHSDFPECDEDPIKNGELGLAKVVDISGLYKWLIYISEH